LLNEAPRQVIGSQPQADPPLAENPIASSHMWAEYHSTLQPIRESGFFVSLVWTIMLDLLIIGAGPAGLACGIEAKQAGLSYLIIDKGSVVDAIRRFPTNLTFFSTPELLEIGNVPFLSSGFRPTRVETVRYYQRVAEHHRLRIHSDEAVTSIRRNNGSFQVVTGKSAKEAGNVVVATGYFDNPSPFDVPGSNLPKVRRYYSEPFEFFGKEVAVVGGKNSAVEIALELFRHGAKVTLIHRGPKLSEGVKYWILPDIENRIKSGEVKALFNTTVREVTEDSLSLDGDHGGAIANDVVFVMIGYRPDNRLPAQAGVTIDEATLAPVHTPETMETNVPGLFVAGSMAAGKFNNKIFIENGRMHGRLIVDAIRKRS
jgi:thioredoxin reductase (NADPH)